MARGVNQIYVSAHEGKIYRLKKGEWKEVGSYNNKGYLQFGFNGKTVKCHRYIYEYVYGEIPDGFEVNHKNHKRDDNRINNLELVTRSQNNQFMQKTQRNTSGCPNISWYSQRQKYIIQFRVNKKLKYYGYYTELKNETIDIRNNIARKLNEEHDCYFPMVNYQGAVVYETSSRPRI